MHIILKMNLQLKLTQEDARCHLLKYMLLRKKSSAPKKSYKYFHSKLLIAVNILKE